jgi:hypothetical protein
MSVTAASILADIAVVKGERHAREANAALGAAVSAVKSYQHRRFSQTYADLLASADFAPAARFFLDELYGPRDFSARDAQFARVVPAMVRLFPHDLADTIGSLAALHALSETFDSAMAVATAGAPLDAARYTAAWQTVGRPEDRDRQIALTLAIGAELDRLTRKAWLRRSLRLMRGPSNAAGLAALQSFLEAGFDTFRAIPSASAFLSLVGERERALAHALFAHPAGTPINRSGILGQLP